MTFDDVVRNLTAFTNHTQSEPIALLALLAAESCRFGSTFAAETRGNETDLVLIRVTAHGVGRLLGVRLLALSST